MKIAMVLAAAILCRAEVVDRIVAVVGNEVITERELDQLYNGDELGLMKADPLSGVEAPHMTREEYLDRLIEAKVIEQEVKRQGIRIDVLEVEKAIDRKRESLGLTEDEFIRALALQGISIEEYREQVKNQLITYRLIGQEVRGEIEVTDEDVLAYYRQHPDQFEEKDKYHLRHIFIAFPANGNTAERKQAVDRLQALRQRALKGEDFTELAKNHSQSPTAPNGGDLGWFELPELLPEFREQVLRLQPGELSPVFVHGNGAHLLLLVEVSRGQVQPLDEVKDHIRDIIFQQYTMERYDLWLERLKARTHIENRLREQGPGPSR